MDKIKKIVSRIYFNFRFGYAKMKLSFVKRRARRKAWLYGKNYYVVHFGQGKTFVVNSEWWLKARKKALKYGHKFSNYKDFMKVVVYHAKPKKNRS